MKNLILILLLFCLILTGCGPSTEVNSERNATDQLLKAQSEISALLKLFEENDIEDIDFKLVEKELSKIKTRIDNSEPYTVSDKIVDRYDRTIEQYNELLEKYEEIKIKE